MEGVIIILLEVCMPFLQKKGHLAKKCRQKSKGRTEHANAVIEEETQIDNQMEYTLSQIRSG